MRAKQGVPTTLLSLTFEVCLQDKGKGSRGVIFFILHPDLLLFFRYYYCDCARRVRTCPEEGDPKVRNVMLLLVLCIVLFEDYFEATFAIVLFDIIIHIFKIMLKFEISFLSHLASRQLRSIHESFQWHAETFAKKIY